MNDRPPNGRGRFTALLRERRCLTFIAARATSQTGSWIERLALGWLIWTSTESTSWLGMIAFIRLAPAVFLAPYGGLLADRSGAALVLRFSSAATTVLALTLAVFATTINPVGLALAALVLGGLQAVSGAPSKTAVSELARKELLPTMIPLNAVGLQTAAFIGPAIGGLIIAVFNVQIAFLVAALGHLVFLAFLLGALGLRAQPVGVGVRGGRAMLDALRYTGGHEVIRNVFLLHAAVSLLMRPLVDLMPAIVGDMPTGGPAVLGVYTGAIGLGAMLGSGWLVWRGTEQGLVAWMLAGAVLSALAILGVVTFYSSSGAAFFFFLFGSGMVVRAAGAQTVIQLMVRDDLRGRLLGGYGAVVRLLSAIGGLLIGLLAEMLALDAILVGLSGLGLLFAVYIGWILRHKIDAGGI